jgi:hypothetical protein
LRKIVASAPRLFVTAGPLARAVNIRMCDRPSRVRTAAGRRAHPCQVSIGPKALEPARLDTHTRRLRGSRSPYRWPTGWLRTHPCSTVSHYRANRLLTQWGQKGVSATASLCISRSGPTSDCSIRRSTSSRSGFVPFCHSLNLAIAASPSRKRRCRLTLALWSELAR